MQDTYYKFNSIKYSTEELNIFKDNTLFKKHFMVQPNMIGYLDIFEQHIDQGDDDSLWN